MTMRLLTDTDDMRPMNGVGTRLGVRAPSRARGQALVLALVSLVVLVLGVIVLFNTGQVLDKKVELVNAADAAAYSVAVQQARKYNAIAYMNRATVANEVAIAQMVSLYSWTNYMIRGADNLGDAIQAIAFVLDASVVLAEVGAALQQGVTALRGIRQVMVGVRQAERLAFPPLIIVAAATHAAYSGASAALGTVAVLDTERMARDLIARNTAGKARISTFGATLLAVGQHDANTYAVRNTIPGRRTGKNIADADRYLNVVMEARDGFTKKRSAEFGFGIPEAAFLGLVKRGGTDLVDYRNWVGIDTLVFKAQFLCTPIGCAQDAKPRVAWGGSGVSETRRKTFRQTARPGVNNGKGWDSPYDHDRGHYQRYDGGIDNGGAGKKVLTDPAFGGQRMAWLGRGVNAGLLDYNDTPANKATVPYKNGRTPRANGVTGNDVGPIFTVLVEQPMNTVRTSAQIEGMGAGDFAMPEPAAGNVISAIASAQVYFSRPRELFPRAIDTRRELGNLFSPYWQARLVETASEVRLGTALAATATP